MSLLGLASSTTQKDNPAQRVFIDLLAYSQALPAFHESYLSVCESNRERVVALVQLNKCGTKALVFVVIGSLDSRTPMPPARTELPA